MKRIILILALILIPMVAAITFNDDTNITLSSVIQSSGSGADCIINVTNSSAFVFNAVMDVDGLRYFRDVGVLTSGYYCYSMECNKSSDVFMDGDCFLVENNTEADDRQRIVNVGNELWITAVGYETEASASTRFDILNKGMQDNTTFLSDQLNDNVTKILSVGDADWSTATDFCTEENVTDIRNDIATSETNIKVNNTLEADRVINSISASSITVAQIWNQTVNCVVNPASSSGCTLWAIERYMN